MLLRMGWLSSLLGLDAASDMTAAAASFSAQPIVTTPPPGDAVHPYASSYRAFRVAQRVALSIPAVRKARAAIAGIPSTFQLTAWEGDTALSRTDPRCSWLSQPDPSRTLQSLLFRTMDDGMWHDRSVWKITNTTLHGDPVDFQRLHPSRVQTIANSLDPDVVDAWVIDRVEYAPSELPGRFLAFDFAGLGGLQTHGSQLLQLYADLQAAAGNYAISPTPKGILKDAGPDLSDAEIDALLDEWELARATRSVAYLNDSLDYEVPQSWSAQELQLTESREHAALEVARLFGLPAFAVDAKSGDPMTYSNVVSRRADLVEALRPWLTVVEQTLSLDDRRAPTKRRGLALPWGIQARFDVDAYTRDDPKTRAETWAILRGAELMSTEEIRQLEPLIGRLS